MASSHPPVALCNVPLDTPGRGHLDGDQVRSACTAPNTKKAYRSYIKGITSWIKATQQSPNEFFCADGSINLEVFLPGHFEAFLLHKKNEGKIKVTTLSGYRSALKDVYRQKRIDLPTEYLDDLKTFFRGLKRVEADGDQEGRSRKPGKEPLTFSLYMQLALRTLALSDNGFAHLFLLTQWNLMCRSKSVETLHIAHLHSADDSVGCVLHKTKTNQEGSGPKDPRHIYANRFEPSCCWMLALGIYFGSNPTLPPGRLFPGSNQKSRFCKIIGKMLEDITGEKVYGTHSIRKGVATFASSGSTGGPSIVSVCLRCGWSLGGVQDRYFRYEAAGDQYLGRVVAGLRQNSIQFAALPPHFQDPHDEFIQDCTLRMFPALKSEPHIIPVLQLCLASIVTHAGFICKNLQPQHALLSSYVFRYPDIMSRLTGMLSMDQSSWMRPTGIPPHVELFQQHLETRRAVNQLPDVLLDGFATLLEDKCVGNQSITRENISSTIRDLLQEAGLWRAHEAIQQRTTASSDPGSIVYHWKSDGRFHRMPEAFVFPQLDALSVWRIWWLGHPAAGYPPFRALQPSDFAKTNRKMFSEWTVLVRHIVAGVETGTGQSMQRPTSQQTADELYHLGMANTALKLPRNTEKQRPDRAVTTLRRIRQAIQEANPEARRMPFRSRKRARADK